MSRRFVRLVRSLFTRPTSTTRPVRRTNLRCDALEDRTVPTTVSVSKVSDTTEGGTAGKFRFTLDSALSSDLDVSYNVMGGSADSSDYSGLGSTVTIPAGKTSADVLVTAARDNLVEGSETVTVELYDDFMPYTKDPMAWSASLDIADDPPVVSVAASASSVGEGAQVTFTFSRTGGDVSQALDVSYMLSGDATSDDYTGLGTSIQIPAGKTEVVEVATITPDNVLDDDEEIWVDVTAGSTYTSSGSYTVVTIEDDPVEVWVEWIADTTEGATGTGAGKVRFHRSGGDTTQALDVNYSYGSSATNEATEDADYFTLSGSMGTGTGMIAFAKNATTADLVVTAKRDNAVEGEEKVTVSVSGDGMYYNSSGGPATVKIADDPPVVSVVKIADAEEGGDAGTFRLYRSGGDLTQSLTVSYVLSGTATEGADYDALDASNNVLSGSIEFAANSSTVDVTIAAGDDQTDDVDETVTLTVTGGSGNVQGVQMSDTLIITDVSTAVISGRAWVDDDVDGLEDPYEPPLSEVTVKLYDGANLIATTKTDINGTYRFAGLPAGSDYYVKFVPLPEDDATLTDQNQGTNDTIDSDPDPSSQLTGPISAAVGQIVTNMDAGFVLAANAAPGVLITFPAVHNFYTLTLTLTAGNKTSRIGPLTVSALSAKDARSFVVAALIQSNWAFDVEGDSRLKITGYQPPNTVLTPIDTAAYTVEDVLPGTGYVNVRKLGTATIVSQPNPLPAAEVQANAVWISVSTEVGYDITVTIETLGNQSITTDPITLSGTTRNGIRTNLLLDLQAELGNDWDVLAAGNESDGGIIIVGKKGPNNTTDRVKKVTLTRVGVVRAVQAPRMSTFGTAEASSWVFSGNSL